MYLAADLIEAVVALVQMGIVGIDTWNSTADDVERPDRIVWDLDPGPRAHGSRLWPLRGWCDRFLTCSGCAAEHHAGRGSSGPNVEAIPLRLRLDTS